MIGTPSPARWCRAGSIDWFCAPRFDSDACFTALVGCDEHGRWSVPGGAGAWTRQRYRDDSMVLETEFVCGGGVVRIVDSCRWMAAAASFASSKASTAGAGRDAARRPFRF
jgi:hypothetical protein